MIFFTSRGGRSNEGTVQIDGMNVGSAFNGGGVAGYGYDTSNAQEVQLTVAGGLGEADRGGPAVQPHPQDRRQHVQRHRTSATWPANGRRATTSTTQLKSFGIPAPGAIIRSWDTSFALGGPIKKDRVWFYGVARTFGAYTDIAGRFGNLNAGRSDPVGLRRRSEHQAAVGEQPEDRRDRVTGQPSPRNKVSGYFDYQKVCEGSSYAKDAQQCRVRGDDWVGGGRIRHVVAGVDALARQRRAHHAVLVHGAGHQQAAARSGRLAVLERLGRSDAGRRARHGAVHPGAGAERRQQPGVATGVPVANMVYHGFAGLSNNHQTHNVWRASLAYVTGAHSMKVGYQAAYEVTDIFGNFAAHGLQYRFNGGVPNQITQRITPWQQANRTRYDALLRAGSVDAQSADAAGRAALRACVELLPGGP